MDFGLLDEYEFPSPSSTAPIYKTDGAVAIPTVLSVAPEIASPNLSLMPGGFV